MIIAPGGKGRVSIAIFFLNWKKTLGKSVKLHTEGEERKECGGKLSLERVLTLRMKEDI